MLARPGRGQRLFASASPLFHLPLPCAQARKHWAQLYRQVPHSVLSWPGRGQRLLADIQARAPDVAALQEVDCWPAFQAHLAALG